MDSRRNAIKKMAAGSVGLALVATSQAAVMEDKVKLKGNINHSVCRWCYSMFTLPELAKNVKEMGLVGIDLIGPSEWKILKEYNLESTMCNGAEISLTEGWNNPEYHSTLVDNYLKHIDMVADAGYTNLICFSGNRRGMDDEVGMNNCVTGLKKIMAKAEKRGVVIQMELFNSKINHPDYMCDKSAWGIELCKRLGSDNFKLLYDIYHMQISEGDIIRTIQEGYQYFGHYHTAGVPGRHEIDESQELYYPAIMKAIVATGYKGYVAQEYVPTNKDYMGTLRKAVELCDV